MLVAYLCLVHTGGQSPFLANAANSIVRLILLPWISTPLAHQLNC